MKKIILLLIIVFSLSGEILYSQVIKAPLNRAWDKIHTPNRKPIMWVYLREADMMWAKRIWRTMDLREKINLAYYYPDQPVNDRKSLAQTLWDAVTVPDSPYKITAYADDDFAKPKTAQEIVKENSRIDSVTVKSKLNPDEDSVAAVAVEFNATDVKQFMIKEDWFFDRQRSVMEVRILSICPLVTKFTFDPVTGEKVEKGKQPLFYIYFPEARPLLAVSEIFNFYNDAERRTFDDIFWKRIFGSYVVKEENVYNRWINDYCNPFDCLLEADRVKNDIFKVEHDLWEF
ncbi:MAG: gliding motility protein GldN [Bacteroidales bacterium]|nr:gliding motility protein GldN [Bacteroidales bacterium]